MFLETPNLWRNLNRETTIKLITQNLQDLSTNSTSVATVQAGLRLGAGQAAAAAAAAAAFLSRFTGGTSSETSVLQPDGAGGLQPGNKANTAAHDEAEVAGVSQQQSQEPVRSWEDWRPEPLLCKRFNVPDPYKGKPPPELVGASGGGGLINSDDIEHRAEKSMEQTHFG